MPASLLARIVFWLWLGGAFAAGHFLVLARMPAIAMPGIVVALAGLLAMIYFRLAAVRTWVDALDLRALVLLHATRFIGLYLLSLNQRGLLSPALIPGAIGDIVIATMALPVAFAPLEEAARRRAIVIWNVAGFVGLLLSLTTTLRLSLSTSFELRPFTSLPLCLVPTFFTPLLLVTHVILFSRTRREPSANG